MKVLVLMIDAYGGRGGIATYNRNLLRALCEHPGIDNITAIPRVLTYDSEVEPPYKLSYLTEAAGSKLKYLGTCLKVALKETGFDLIICSHIHLLPFAFLLKSFLKCPVVPVTYGIDAWTPTSRWSVNFLCRKLDAFISIRKLTAKRLIEWAGIDHAKFYYLPNCIDESQYGVAPKCPDLEDRYGIRGKTVIMTAGRLDTTDNERNKGFDEIIEVLPGLREQMPDIIYLIMGDGDDQERLFQKAKSLGVVDIVVFTGYVSEREKADHYRLADVFAMPGSNKRFDRYPFRFVFLEALACGVPVVGSSFEHESEANDPDAQQLIIQVDPNSRDDIKRGILNALKCAIGKRAGIENFYFPAFKDKVHSIVGDILGLKQ
jgi:glycosyltransferase involved in cell wall biosynthesis